MENLLPWYVVRKLKGEIAVSMSKPKGSLAMSVRIFVGRC
jgi:hypothetical protein